MKYDFIKWIEDYGQNMIANEEYISDGNILFAKKYLWSNLLNGFTRKSPSLCMDFIPHEKGIDVECTGEALLDKGSILVKFGDFYFDKCYLDLIEDLCPVESYTLVQIPQKRFKYNADALLKFWDSDDNFLGCLANKIPLREAIERFGD